MYGRIEHIIFTANQNVLMAKLLVIFVFAIEFNIRIY